MPQVWRFWSPADHLSNPIGTTSSATALYSRCRGTAIFISFSLNFSIVKYHRDLDGRFQYIDIKIDDLLYTLLNIYAPNNEGERKVFLDDIYPFILTQNCKIMVGYCNCVMNPKIDKKGGNLERGSIRSDKISQIVTDFELVDVYRHLNSTKFNVTWYSKNISCRLDRFYFSRALKPYIKQCFNLPFSFSYHDCIVSSFINSTEVKKGDGYWKLNASILNDKVFWDSFREWFIEFTNELDICIEMWDYFKETIKEVCISYGKKKKES